MPPQIQRNSERYERLVPTRFRNSSGFNHISFNVVDARPSPFQYVRDSKGGARQITVSAYCEMGDGGVFLIDIHLHPVLAEAVLLLGQLLSTNEKAQRYNTLFKIYECIEPNTNIEFAAIRHALSHASSNLSRPKTMAILRNLFGGTKINLESYKHQRVFYSKLVSLLNETDRLLFKSIMKEAQSLHKLSSSREVLHDWQIAGIPGLYKPIPLSRNGA